MYLRSWILPLSPSDFLFSLSEKQNRNVSRMPMGAGPRAVTQAGRRAVINKATSQGRRVSASGLSGVPR